MLVNNNVGQTFKGRYILKGADDIVSKASEKITTALMQKGEGLPTRDFLSPHMIQNQKYVKALITTQDDKAIMQKYRRIRQQSYNPYGNVVQQGFHTNDGVKYVNSHIDSDRLTVAQVRNANDQALLGKLRPLKTLVDKDAQSTLGKIESLTGNSIGAVKELNARRVLNAIEQGKFNYMDGTIG